MSLKVDVPTQGAVQGHVRMDWDAATPEDIVALCLSGIVTSSMLFERLQAHGTNLVLRIRPDSLTLDVLARKEEDGLDLLWQPKELDAARMDELQARIRDKTFPMQHAPAQRTEPEREAPKAAQMPVHQEPSGADEDEHLVRHITRIP